MRGRARWLLMLALGLGVLAPAAADAAPKPGLWAGVRGDAEVSFVIAGGRLTELVVSCNYDPAPLDTARRYRIAPRGELSPSDGGPPLRGRLSTTTAELTLARPPTACAFAKSEPLKVKAMPPPRVRDGVYRATGPVALGNGSHDISFRIDGGGGVVRDFRGHLDGVIPPSTPTGLPTPCTGTYDGLLPDRTILLSEQSGSTELGFGSYAPNNGPNIQGYTSTTPFGPPDVPAGQIKGVTLGGDTCPGGALLTANLETPEEAATEPIPGFGSGFPGPPVGRPGCTSTADAPPIKAIAACFAREGILFVSSGRVRANGIDITPAAGSQVVLDPRRRTITSRGTVDVRVGPVFLYRGALSRRYALGKITALDVRIGSDYSIDDNVIGGLPITGSVKLTLDPAGSTNGAVSVTLPKPFAHTNATVSFRATNERGLVLDQARLDAASIKPLPLVELANLSAAYAPQPGGAVHWDGAGTLYVPFNPGRCAKKLVGRSKEVLGGGKVTGVALGSLFGLGLGVTVGFGVGDGYLRLGANVDSLNCYIAYGVFLQRLAVGGGADPFTVIMGAGFSFGPRLKVPLVGRQEAATLDGSTSLTYNSDEGFTRTWTGKLKIAFTSLDGSLTLSLGGADLEANGEYSIIPGAVRMRSHMRGWVDRDAFNLEGNGAMLVLGPEQGSESVISSVGAAGCRTGIGPHVGWGYRWGDDSISWFSRSCGIGGFRAARSVRAAQAGAGTSFEVPRGRRIVTFAAVGTDQPPIVRLTGPNVDVTTSPSELTSTARVFTLPDPPSHTTYLAVQHPRAGRFTVTPVPGSPAVARVMSAQSRPPTRVLARVNGSGAARRLIYRTIGLDGAKLVFTERGAAQRRIGSTSRPRGSIRFLVRPSRGGRRRIEVTVLHDGVPEPARLVASYRAPPARRASKPLRLRVRRTRTGRTVTWLGPRRARYVVDARLSDGRRLHWEVARRHLTIGPLGPATRVRVTVRRRDVLGRPGASASARG